MDTVRVGEGPATGISIVVFGPKERFGLYIEPHASERVGVLTGVPCPNPKLSDALEEFEEILLGDAASKYSIVRSEALEVLGDPETLERVD